MSSGRETNVPMVEGETGKCHTLYGVKAVSLQERRAKIEVNLRPQLNFDHTNGEHILARFADLGKNLRHDATIVFSRASWGKGCWPSVVVEVELKNGDQFCSTAIKLVREIFGRLGVEDAKGYNLAQFTLKQADFVPFEGQWISFVRWLRIENQLPVACLGDEENIEMAVEV